MKRRRGGGLDDVFLLCRRDGGIGMPVVRIPKLNFLDESGKCSPSSMKQVRLLFPILRSMKHSPKVAQPQRPIDESF